MGDSRSVVVSELWSLKAGGLLIQVVSNTSFTVFVIQLNIHVLFIQTLLPVLVFNILGEMMLTKIVLY